MTDNTLIYEYNHDTDTALTAFFDRNIDNEVRPHFHRCFELIYLTRGSMTTQVNGESFATEKDDIVFVNNYYPHAYTPVCAYDKYVVVIPFTLDNDFNAIFQKKTLAAHLDDGSYNQRLLPYFTLLAEEKDMSPLVAKGFLNVILGRLVEHYPLVPTKKNGNIGFLVEVLNYIDAHYSENLTLEGLASHFGYNKYYFSKLFNRYIGRNINYYVNMTRLKYFLNTAQNEKHPNIANIAYSCGFESLTSFYRYFSLTFNCSPSEKLSGAPPKK